MVTVQLKFAAISSSLVQVPGTAVLNQAASINLEESKVCLVNVGDAVDIDPGDIADPALPSRKAASFRSYILDLKCCLNVQPDRSNVFSQ